VLNCIVLKKLLGVEGCVVKNWRLEAVGLVVGVELHRRQRQRCGICQKRCPWYDNGGGRRQWRSLDWDTTLVFLEAEAPRVTCKEHGVVVAKVPWARHLSRFTLTFEQQTAWLAKNTSRLAASNLVRIAWRSVTDIVGRVVAQGIEQKDPLEGLTRLGIDEISYRKGHKYLSLVYDHDANRLAWAAEGRSAATLEQFFLALGPERCSRITHVSADGATWIASTVSKYCPQAIQCLDPFHVVEWVTVALDAVRREVWNDARAQGERKVATDLKGARWALWKNPEDLTRKQQTQLAAIAKTNEPLYRAYLLKGVL
jgi:transposase